VQRRLWFFATVNQFLVAPLAMAAASIPQLRLSCSTLRATSRNCLPNFHRVMLATLAEDKCRFFVGLTHDRTLSASNNAGAIPSGAEIKR